MDGLMGSWTTWASRWSEAWTSRVMIDPISFPYPPMPQRFSEWPNDALEAVALKFLKDLDVEAKQRTQVSACVTVRESCTVSIRPLSVSPASKRPRLRT